MLTRSPESFTYQAENKINTFTCFELNSKEEIKYIDITLRLFYLSRVLMCKKKKKKPYDYWCILLVVEVVNLLDVSKDDMLFIGDA